MAKKAELKPGCLRDVLVRRWRTDGKFREEYRALSELLKDRLPEKLKKWYDRYGVRTLQLLFERNGMVNEDYERRYANEYGLDNFDALQELFAELQTCWAGIVTVNVSKWTENKFHVEWRLDASK